MLTCYLCSMVCCKDRGAPSGERAVVARLPNSVAIVMQRYYDNRNR